MALPVRIEHTVVGRVFSLRSDSVQRKPSRAVSGSGNDGGPGVFGVELDRFDHQVKFIGAVDFAHHTVGLARHALVGFGEVMHPIDTLSVAVEHQEHRTTSAVLFRREQEEAIGAEVEHDGRNGEIMLSRRCLPPEEFSACRLSPDVETYIL
jgi:hypothetical protein